MQQCRKCRVNVDGDKGRCPLCQGELTGERERDMFPRIAEPRFGSEFLIKLISFIAISAIVICAATDYLLSGRLSWSVYSIDSLLSFIMIDHYNLLFAHPEKISSGNHSYIAPLFVMNREVTVSFFSHYLAHLISVRLGTEGYKALSSHKKTYRHRLIYES